MGNRNTVYFPDEGVTVYLHWNGGPESIIAFLNYMEGLDDMAGRLGQGYFAARFCQLVGNYFGGTLSLGIHGGDQRGMYGEDNDPIKVALKSGHLYMSSKNACGHVAALVKYYERHKHPYYTGPGALPKDIARHNDGFFRDEYRGSKLAARAFEALAREQRRRLNKYS